MLAEHAACLLDDQRDQLVMHAALDQQIVGSHARLADVEPFAERDTAGRHTQVGRGVDDAGALATEFERDRREVPGSPFHHQFANMDATGEEDVVPPLIEQRRVLGAAALDDANEAWVERLLANPSQHRTRSRGVGARLEHHGVSGGERARERLERQQERIVPRRHDERHTEGHLARAADAHRVGEVAGAEPGTRPPGDMGKLVTDLGAREPDLAHIGLVMRLAQIGLKRPRDIVLVRAHRGEQAFERTLAGADIECRMRIEIHPLALDDVGDLRCIHL